MSVALLDELLAGYVMPPRVAYAALTHAKAANSANREHPRGPAPVVAACDGLRIPAKPADADSQAFAGVRSPQTGPQSEETCRSLQDSQNSQGYAWTALSEADLAAVVWTDADIAKFLDRRARLLRWGWAEPDADALAERLVRRDHEKGDDRVSCTGCSYYRPGRCGNHRQAGLYTPDVGRDLATLLQRCPGFDQGGL